MIMMGNDIWGLIPAVLQDTPPDATMARLVMMTMELSVATIKTAPTNTAGADILSTVATPMVFWLEQTLT